MRSQIANRLRSNSIPLNSVPPPHTSKEYSRPLASLAARILYRSPLTSQNDLRVFILNAAGFPDARTTDYDALLPYVLTRLPEDEELVGGQGYEIVFFAGGGGGDEALHSKKGRPGWGWFLQAYHVLSRATRKRLQKLYIVHEKNWVRLLVEMFATVVSPKFRKKIVHVSTLSGLALHIPIEDLLIPPSAYLTDRRKTSYIHTPYASGRRAFGVKEPLHTAVDGSLRLPRVLREATAFVLMDDNAKTTGIFRVSARAQTVEILREAYDRGQKFIVWKEGSTVLASSHRREGRGDVGVEELDQTEGYELHAAAALIKFWYKALREPFFPPTCYHALEKFYGNSEVPLELSQLLPMLSVEDDGWSLISNKTSRHILIMHLLPLLSRISDYQDWNQMTPDNLAVCFAPSLLHGLDPIEDLRISGIVRRILVAMITHWRSLEPLLNMSFERFEESLRMPEAVEDREDPLEEAETKQLSDVDTQVSRITLQDNEDSDEDEEGSPPPLPPRPRATTVDGILFNTTNPFDVGSPGDAEQADSGQGFRTGSVDAGAANGISPVRRKPAPPLMPLPRYSKIVNGRPAARQGIQYYNTVTPGDNNSGEADEMSGLPQYQEVAPVDEELPRAPPSLPPLSEQSIQRKPLPKTASEV